MFNPNRIGPIPPLSTYIPASGVIPIDPDAQAYFDACDTAGSPVTGNYITWYNNVVIQLKASGDWAKLDCLYIDATGDRVWASIDLKDPSRTATINNPYSGDFGVGTGWKGNGTDFSILTNFNPGNGGTYNFVRNSASFGALFIDNLSAQTTWDIGCSNAGFTQGILGRAYIENSTTRNFGSVNSVFWTTNSYNKPILNSYAWIGMHRTGANAANTFYNGVNIETITGASTALENKQIGRFGAYNGSFAPGFYTLNRQGAFYAGAGDVSQKNLLNVLNTYFFVPQSTKAALTKRVIFEGDSRTADIAFPSLSNTFAYPKRALSNAGDNWCGAAVSTANDTIQNMITTYSSEIEPYRNTLLTKDVVVIWAGTNDIAAGRSATQVYDDMVTFCTNAKADGFKVIIIGEIDRNWSSYAAMNAVRAAYRTSLLADFNQSTAFTNIWAPPLIGPPSYADLMIDIYAETNFQSYLSAWYQGDGIHPNTTGSNVVADYLSDALTLI